MSIEKTTKRREKRQQLALKKVSDKLAYKQRKSEAKLARVKQ